MGDAGDPPLTVKWDLAASQVLDPEGGVSRRFHRGGVLCRDGTNQPVPTGHRSGGQPSRLQRGRAIGLPMGPKRTVEWSRLWMFVQCLGGISHNKLEDTREDHLELSVAALDRLASKTVDWVLGGQHDALSGN